MNLQGKKNIYVCENCKWKFVTVDRDAGTTPFLTTCRSPKGCKGVAQSEFYRVDQGLTPAFEWYKPGADEFAKIESFSVREHVSKGGLLLRPIVAAAAPSPRDDEHKILFAVAPAAQNDGASVLLVGVSTKCWEYMRDGKTHTVDLTKIGVPLQLIVYGGADYASVVKVIEDHCKEQGQALLDLRRQDFSIEPKKT